MGKSHLFLKNEFGICLKFNRTRGRDDEEETSDDTEEDEDIYLADVEEYLSLRDAPNADSDVIAEIQPLTEMELISEASYPYLLVYVPSVDKEGYVHRDYIVKKGDTLKRAKPEE